MAKEIKKVAKIQLVGGAAKPDAKLASFGINMGEFTKKFNDETKDMRGKVIPVLLTAYSDKSFSYVLKTTPAADLLKEAAKITDGAKNAKTDVAGTVTRADIKKIAEMKMRDLNASSIESAMKIIEGTARSMGIRVKG